MHLQMRRIVTSLLLSASCIIAMAQQTVKGTVTDAQGEPMIGVSVAVDGKPVTVTDFDGHFTLPSAKATSKVEFSYMGWRKTVRHSTKW